MAVWQIFQEWGEITRGPGGTEVFKRGEVERKKDKKEEKKEKTKGEKVRLPENQLL